MFLELSLKHQRSIIRTKNDLLCKFNFLSSSPWYLAVPSSSMTRASIRSISLDRCVKVAKVCKYIILYWASQKRAVGYYHLLVCTHIRGDCVNICKNIRPKI